MRRVASHLNLNFATWALLCSLAEALYGGEDFVSGIDPFVRLWVVVVNFDEGGDVGFQFGSGAVDATL